MGNPTMWFEVAGKDREALKRFCSQLFDWQLTGMDAMPYTTIDAGGEGIPAGSARRLVTIPATSPSTPR